MENKDKPINPIFNSDGFASDPHNTLVESGFIGLTKREYFAALAMQGYCANISMNSERAAWVAKVAIQQADELLTQLDKTK